MPLAKVSHGGATTSDSPHPEAVRELGQRGSGLVEYEAGEGDEVQAPDYFGQALVVAHKRPKARCPGEAALQHSAPGQEREAALGLGQAHHLQADSVLACCRLDPLPSVALVDKGHRNTLVRRLLDCPGEEADLGAAVCDGGRDMKREQVPQRVHGACTFAPRLRLASS